jgi:hypothetical protein
MMALLLIGMGILLIAFPEFFALIAACFLFAGAFICLSSAWRVYHATRQVDDAFSRQVEVTVRDPDDNVIDV